MSKPGLGAEGAPSSVTAEVVDALGAEATAEEEKAEEKTEEAKEENADSGETVTGVVKKWNDKGYGFIAPDDGEKDVFVHSSVIQQEGVRALVEGEKVCFKVHTESDGRLKATDLTGPNGGNLRGTWEEDDDVQTGTVARWRGDKGFGFITPAGAEVKEGEEKAKDVFVHVNDCGAPLTEGSTVEYTMKVEDDGRLRALKVMLEGGRPLPQPMQASGFGGAMR